MHLVPLALKNCHSRLAFCIPLHFSNCDINVHAAEDNGSGGNGGYPHIKTQSVIPAQNLDIEQTTKLQLQSSQLSTTKQINTWREKPNF